MSQLTEALEIAASEERRNFVYSITSEFLESLRNQGFGLDEVIDALMNHAWANTNSVDAVSFLCQAALALKDDKTNG